MKSFIKHLFRWIKKSIQYSIVLWNDYDWDYTSILCILKYKIQRTRKHLETCSVHCSHENSIKKMKVVEHILQRLIDNDYCSEEYDQHHEKYKWKDYLKKVENHTCYLWDPPEEYRKESKRLLDKSAKLEQHDWEQLFKLLNKHIKHWWC